MNHSARKKTKPGILFLLVIFISLPVFYWLKTHAPAEILPGKSSPDLKETFQTLHKNLYQSFNEPNSEAAYDRLARSVDEPMLETVYREVYQYFQAKNADGPTVEIMEVKLRTFEQENIGGPGSRHRYRILAGWDVLSIVTHYKHWHARTNNYKGTFTLQLREGRWKIVEDNILWQRRIPVDLKSFKGTQT